MISEQLRSFLRKHWLASGCVLAASCVAIWLVIALIIDVLDLDRRKIDEIALKGWMTPRYVVLNYDLPRQVVADAFGFTSLEQRRMPVRDIAAAQGITIEELTKRLRDAAERSKDKRDDDRERDRD